MQKWMRTLKENVQTLVYCKRGTYIGEKRQALDLPTRWSRETLIKCCTFHNE
jgi:hypothetical protein